ncbi:hypothetical protein Q4506_08865 [Colwellia sp. 4_MG-2023]|uniref:hypothetical protein n=1 Tax=unclassified Colwellia TaxID=196834 RepID=UPI0026E1CB7F|nr:MULTISPECIES: hypothetical protein [unclassified Colwellia]MDO6506832.1 hypothetical protein [Colwellia sp. 5_MG-2023]MDO6555793.1 hypothetical protein [Colwellia sp. 4_MG-2023]
MTNYIQQYSVFTFLFISLISFRSIAQVVSIEFSAPANESILILPVPNMKIASNSSLKITQQGKTINASFYSLNIWDTDKTEKFVRLLTIKLKNVKNKTKDKPLNFILSWSQSNRSLSRETITFNKQPYLVFPNKSWLSESILLHPKTKKNNSTWYTQGQILYANFVTNESLLSEKGYAKTKYSQWLFDRPRAIYQLYILTGDPKWLKEGTKLAEFYLENLDETGKFKLKENFDLKYLMPNGLLYYYFLTADSKIENVLKTLFEKSLIWTPKYENEYKFWTERHQAAALNLAIAYWEISGSQRAKNRIDEIVDATVQMVFNPINDWPLRSCPQHTYESHEGKPGNSPVCSPWMMALLGDGLWRYYRLTNDKKSAALLNAFGDFMPNYGIHFADKRLNNKVLPLYLASMGNKLLEIRNQWTDGQHACDVAGLIGKSIYIKKKSGEEAFLLKELFNVFIQQCKDIDKKYRNSKKDYSAMLPPRRFGWTYSTTSDLPWLEFWLNQAEANE